MRARLFVALAAAAAALAAALAVSLGDVHTGAVASTVATASMTASTTTQTTTSSSAPADRPPVTASVQAPPAPSNSRVFAAVSQAFQTMRHSLYSHHYYENAITGTYDFDCVGLADYFLTLGAPKAIAALRSAEHIPSGPDVPSRDHFADSLGALPAGGNGLWRPITHVRQIEPGDLIIMKKINSKTFVGHALIAASAKLLLANGTFALNVFDSTGQTHGPDDSRNWDTRTTPLKGASNGSGLGFGTIQLWVNLQSGTPEQISWQIGRGPVQTPIVIARALH
ncbi:MAG TPA: hypothetical protein VMU39_25220 [Solirubrobacteraceae bacterium]|nr:hypothetical protein [Solirubrobacteraceae bacterium]